MPDVSVEMPDELDLSYLRSKGRQPGEEELPETTSAASESQGNINSITRSKKTLGARILTLIALMSTVADILCFYWHLYNP